MSGRSVNTSLCPFKFPPPRLCLILPLHMILFMLVQTVYWIALSVWFGGLMFISIIWPIIYRTIGEADPTLPTVLSVNLEKSHGSLLAGNIVANILRLFSTIQLGCAGAVLLTLLAQWGVMDLSQ